MAGKRKRFFITEPDVVRLCWFANFLPFVEPVGKDQAAALLHRRPKRRLRGGRLRASVNHRVADRRVFGRGRRQTPAKQDQFAALSAGVRADRRHLLGGCNVEPRPEFGAPLASPN